MCRRLISSQSCRNQSCWWERPLPWLGWLSGRGQRRRADGFKRHRVRLSGPSVETTTKDIPFLPHIQPILWGLGRRCVPTVGPISPARLSDTDPVMSTPNPDAHPCMVWFGRHQDAYLEPSFFDCIGQSLVSHSVRGRGAHCVRSTCSACHCIDAMVGVGRTSGDTVARRGAVPLAVVVVVV